MGTAERDEGVSREVMRRTTRSLKIAAVVLAGVTSAYAFIDGPPASRTGAPGESNCTECHIGTLNSSTGSIRIEGVPGQYTPGQEITLTVRVLHSSRLRWGFQLTAL